MLPRKYRLTQNYDFEKVKNEGEFYQSKYFALLVVNRKDDQCSKIGFVVSKKVSKLAVKRNKVKRMLRNIVSGNLANIVAGYDLVFLGKKIILSSDKKDIQKQVTKTLSSANLIR